MPVDHEVCTTYRRIGSLTTVELGVFMIVIYSWGNLNWVLFSIAKLPYISKQ